MILRFSKKSVLIILIFFFMIIIAFPHLREICYKWNLGSNVFKLIFAMILPYSFLLLSISNILVNIILSFILLELSDCKIIYQYVDKSPFRNQIVRNFFRMFIILLILFIVFFTYLLGMNAIGMVCLFAAIFFLLSHIFVENKLFFINNSCYAINEVNRTICCVGTYESTESEDLKLFFKNGDGIRIYSKVLNKNDIIDILEKHGVQKKI